MADSYGISEAGKAWIYVSVQNDTEEAFKKVADDLKNFSATVQEEISVVDKTFKNSAASYAEYFGNLSKNATLAGQMLTAGWDKFADKGKDAVNVFAQVDDQMRATFAKVDGISEQQAESLTKKAKELGRQMSFTTSQVAEGMTTLASQGFGAEQIEAAIAPIMNLARATQTDVPTAALIAANAMHQFGLESEDMTRICDVLTTTTNKSAQGLTDIGYAIQYSGTNFAQAGSSLEDYMKLLGSLANFGTKGSMGGTSLRTMLARSISPQTQAKLEGYGISVKDEETGNLKSMADILAQISAITDKMGSGDKQELLLDLFGQRGMTGAASLIQGSFETMEEAIDHAEGAAQRAADAMDAGLGGSQRMMDSAIEALKISYGEAIAPNVQSFFDQVKQLSSAMSEWVSNHKALVVSLTEVGVGVSALGGALLVLGTVAGAVRNIILLWGPTMAMLSKSFGVASSAAGVLSKAFLFITANPIVGLLAAVAALAGLIGVKMYQASKASREYASSMQEMARQHEQQDEADQQAMRRLQELASQQQLTNSELLEAQEIVLELGKRYGDLGIEVNGATRSITGLTEAQKKMLDAQKKLRQADIDKELKEVRSNAQKAEKKVSEETLGGGKEYTAEEIRAMDEERKNRRGPNSATMAGGVAMGGSSEASFADRAVKNPETGKYVILKDLGIMAKRNRTRMTEALEMRTKSRLQEQYLTGELERFEEISEETEKNTAPAEANTPPAPQEQNSPVTPEPATPAATAAKETQPAPAPTVLTAGSAAEETTAANPYSDPDVAAALNLASPALVPFQGGDDLAVKLGDLESQVGALNAQIAESGSLGGEDPAASAAEAQLAAAKEEFESAQSSLKYAQEAEHQTAQQQGAEMQQSVADWKNGPGSASYNRMDITDKAIVDTAENTKITADYVKKLYDLLKANGGQAVFAQ